jgi:hypothetical protein
LNALSSGLVLLWLAGGAFVASGAAGASGGKIPPRVSVQVGVLLELVGVAGIAFFAANGGGWGPIAPFLFIYGFGVGMATAQLTGVILVDVPFQKIGQASGSQSTLRQIGSALGIAVLGTTLFAFSQTAIESRIENLEMFKSAPAAEVAEVAKSLGNSVVDSAGGVIPSINLILEKQQMSADHAQAIEDAAAAGFTDGVKATGWAAAAFLLLGFFATFNLGSRKKKQDA